MFREFYSRKESDNLIKFSAERQDNLKSPKWTSNDHQGNTITKHFISHRISKRHEIEDGDHIMAASSSDTSLMMVSSSTVAIRSPKSPSKHRQVEYLFPSKVYEMLETVESLGLSAAVSWQPHGRSFVINDKKVFMTDVVPRFFKATKLRSFQRQCHLWGYHR